MNKKFYLLGLCVAASATVANAQQLPNVGFEQWKDACGTTTWTSTMYNSGADFTRPGVEPAGWNGSSVSSFGMKMETVSNGGNYVEIKNYNISIPFLGVNQTVPGYLTLATPWVFVGGTGMLNANSYAKYGDGGSYGGVEFSNRPDAIKLRYQKTTTTETSHVVAYLWAGEFKSNVPSSVTDDGIYTYGRALIDVDRVVLGRQTDNVTATGKLIAKMDKELSELTEDWVDLEIPFEYVDAESVPEKVNVIISSADYWTRANLQANSTLLVDDVDFVYYSTLTDLKVNGEAVALEEGKYGYAMSGSALPTEEQVVATAKSQFANAVVTVDAENAQVRIVVTNQGGKDVDGETSHTYVLQYEKAAEPEQYQGYLNIKIDGSSMAENQAATIEITETGEGKCTFVLPDLTLTGIGNLGDIEVSDVAVTVDDNETKTYAGSVEGMSLMGGAIGADVELNGTIDVNGICDFKIDVLWNSMAGQPMDTPVPINVTFTTNEIPAGVEGINGEAVAVYGVAGAVAVSGCNGAVDVYTADGRLVKSVMVDGSAEIALDGGLYIVRAGGEAYKVFVK